MKRYMKFELLNKKFSKQDDSVMFIENFCINLVQEIKQYYFDLGENPLQYRERILSSVIFPAFMRTGRRAVMEVYYCKFEESKRNYLDYYVMDSRGENSYLVEFKHGWYDYDKGKLIDFNKKKWTEVNKQIEKLENEKEVIHRYIDSDKNIYGLSMYMLVSQSYMENITFEHEKYKKIILEELDKFDWIFTKKLVDECNLFQLDKLYYPNITLIGRITEIDRIT